jgi:hypothetical protein
MAAITQSQGPDLNRSVADLQSAAWPLRHLGSRVYIFITQISNKNNGLALQISSGFNSSLQVLEFGR